MGKISDALEKSKENRIVPLPSNRMSDQVRVKEKKDFLLNDTVIETFSGRSHLEKNLITMLRPESFEAEQFKILRSKILYPVSGTPPRSIMITSALPGEGKTFVSANLAVTISQSINEHVLLLDCDIRAPNIHKYFGYDKVKGLSEYLSDGLPLQNLLLKTALDKLTILPGGRPPRNPSELLSSKKMADLLDEVTARYSDRYILIDSPPPGLTAETSVIARKVEGILFVIKSGETPKELASKLIDSLGKSKVIGIVMNKFDQRSSIAYGYGRYGKYGSYGNDKNS